MTLVKFNKRPELSVNNLFNEFFNEDPLFWKSSVAQGLHYPPVNIFESEGAYHIEVNAPGRKKEDFSIELSDAILTIRFEQKSAEEPASVKVLRREFSVKSFKRSFTIDEQIDAEKIEARYENGVLLLTLPKKAQVKEGSKVISIQ